MTTYREIASTETDPEAPITSSLMKAFQGNVLAIAEGDATAPSPLGGIANKSSSDGVGTYALLRFASLTIAAHGSTHAGSSLRFANASGRGNATPSGTWRLMGETTNVVGAATESVSVFLRIA